MDLYVQVNQFSNIIPNFNLTVKLIINFFIIIIIIIIILNQIFYVLVEFRNGKTLQELNKRSKSFDNTLDDFTEQETMELMEQSD